MNFLFVQNFTRNLLKKEFNHYEKYEKEGFDKKEIIVYDYVDDNFKQTRNMFEKRKKTE